MDELISRQAALDAVNIANDNGQILTILDVLDVIKALPPVQPKHGEWEYHSNPTIGINPETVDEFMEEYKVVDSEHVYSNGMEMVPIFRMKQWFEHEANHNAELGKIHGKWILDRSGAYCCSECMEPCASYVMMKPRDKFCKMCGSRNEVTE